MLVVVREADCVARICAGFQLNRSIHRCSTESGVIVHLCRRLVGGGFFFFKMASSRNTRRLEGCVVDGVVVVVSCFR